MKKKGQAISFGNAPSLAVLFGVLVLVIGAMAVGLQAFKDSQTSSSYADNITGQGLAGLDNFADQTPTIGTMLGVALIVVVIIGAFGMFFLRGRGAGL